MRAWIVAVVVVVSLPGAKPVAAGVYCTFEKPFGPTPSDSGAKELSYDGFQLALSERTDLRNPAKEKARAPYLKRRDELQAKIEGASVEDLINLSYCLIVLGEHQKAIDLLQPLARDPARRHGNDFRVFANLGTANQIIGELGRAYDYLQDARDYFPKPGQTVSGLSKEQLDWFRAAEKAQFRLLRERRKQASTLAAGQAPQTVDALFEVRFIGDSGQYEAGKIATAEKDKLPKNAVPLVQQLMLWLPEPSGLSDVRLYWLLGELLNAQGDVKDASDVLGRCSWDRNFNPPELREHRQVLVEALAQKPPPPASWLPDTPKLIVVGSITVVVIVFLGVLQVREMRRRRSAQLGRK